MLFTVRSRTKFDDASILGASLVTYLVVSIGGWQWGVAPLIVFANYLFLDLSRKGVHERVYPINTLLAVTMPGFFWLMLHYRYHQSIYFFSYTIGYMSELIGLYLMEWALLRPEKSLLLLCLKGASFGYCMIMVPYLLCTAGDFSLSIMGLSLLLPLFSAQLFCSLLPFLRTCSMATDRFLIQGIIGFVSSVVPLLLPID